MAEKDLTPEQVRHLFQMGQKPGAVDDTAKADVTTVSPPKIGGPSPPTKPSAKKEVDNPSQYGKPPVIGPAKPHQKAPSFEDIAKGIDRIAGGEKPSDVARELLVGEEEEQKEEEESESETNEAGDRTIATAKGAGVGTSAQPKVDGPKKGEIHFERSAAGSNLADDVRKWLDSLPEAKKALVGDTVVHKTGPAHFQLDHIAGILSLEAATQAIVLLTGDLEGTKLGAPGAPKG